jgi:hypothetical protein
MPQVGTPQRIGNESQLNDITTSGQNRSNVTLLQDGSYVVVYDSNQTGDFDVFARIFNANGTASGPAFTVNTTTAGIQVFAEIITLSNGNFVVAWRSDGNAEDASSTGVFGRVFAPDGTPITGEFIINDTTLGTQRDVAISALDNGGFVAAYTSQTSPGTDISGNSVLARIFDATGNETTAEFQVNVTESLNQEQPDIATLSDGSFVITYDAANVDANLDAVVARRFSEDGTPQTGEITVNTNETGTQQNGRILALSNGNYAVAYEDANGTADVFVRIFDAATNTGGATIQVNTFTTGVQQRPEIAATEDGGFIVAYTSAGQVNLQDIFAQRFDAAGNPVGEEFMINSQETSTSAFNLTALTGRQLLATFEIDGLDGDGRGIFGQTITTNQAPGAISISNSSLPENTVDGAIIGTLSANDSDGDDVTFTTSDNRFEITSGNILRAREGVSFNFETTPIVFVAVNASDGNGSGNSAFITVNIENVIEDGVTITNPQSNDDRIGGEGDDFISDNDNSNELRGNAGNDTLLGNGGNDFIQGGLGDDFANGGAGNDQIFAGPGDEGNDRFQGGAGNDVIGGSAGDDIIIGDGVADAAGNLIFENDGADLDGNDTLFGGPGNDLIITGSFNDDVTPNGIVNSGEIRGRRSDTAFAGTGDDTVFGSAGGDVIGGGEGNDRISTYGGNDTIFGGVAGDTPGNDTLLAGGGNDQVFGGDGNDLIDGGSGNDELFNGTGSDTVEGGRGEDTLFAGAGDDLLSGGEGEDTFFFASNSGSDIVTDFEIDLDQLDFSGTVTNFTNLDDVIAAIIPNADTINDDGITIDLGGNNTVFLQGITQDDLSDITIIF